MDTKKESFPLIPVRNTIVFPTTSIFLLIGREESMAALKAAQKADGKVVIVGQITDRENGGTEFENLYKIGTLCDVRRVTGTDTAGYQILVTGSFRFKIEDISKVENYLEVSGSYYPDEVGEDPKSVALFNNLKTLAAELVELLPGADDSVQNLINQITKQDEMVYLGASYLKLKINQMQDLLEEADISKKMKMLLELFIKEKEVLLLEKDIKDKVGKSLTQKQREVLLREQLRAIRNELGESEEIVGEEYSEKIRESGMPEEVRKIANEEVTRLKAIHSSSAEHQVIRNYLDLLCQMPWDKSTDENIDLAVCEEILETHHFGLKKIKKRILEHIAVNRLKGNLKGPILCLYGPPGVGKTSLGKSIAKALGREFVRASLGGVRDESEIRGHRRTYVGAMPGKIVQSIKRVGVNNPLILLDEIDKLGSSVQGDPSSALLEVLDPEQNNTFVDHYLDVPFDLSKVFFVATANQLDTIPGPLRDRMELIELSSYTLVEKLNICEKFIVPQVLEENGLNKTDIVFADNVYESLIEHYTREAGVRELKRVLSNVCRSAAYDILKGASKPLYIKNENARKYLGPVKYLETQKLRKWSVGLVTGLAWTPVGGDVLYLECLAMPGNGKLKLTGQLGDVMKESAELALSYTRSWQGQLNPEFDWDHLDIHMHIPAGAIPKDGPSAGVTILSAIISLVTKKEISQDLAMTGEITLSGSVLPVGGIKEKIIAAHRNKITKVILPKENEKDLVEIPEEIKSELEFFPVKSVDEVLDIALDIKLLRNIPTLTKERPHGTTRHYS